MSRPCSRDLRYRPRSVSPHLLSLRYDQQATMGSLKLKKPIRGYPSFSLSFNMEPHSLQHSSQPLPASLASPLRPPPRPPYAHVQLTVPIETVQQSYDWFTIVECSAAHSQESHLRKYLKGGEHSSGICEMLAMRMAEMAEVEGMLLQWSSVKEEVRRF